MSRKRSALWATIVLSGLVVSCSSSSETGPGASVKQFYDHLNDGNYAAAQALYSSDAMEIIEMSPADAFAGWASQETKQGSVEQVEIREEEIASDAATATVDCRVIYSDGSNQIRQITLTQEEGRWKLGTIG